jgi:hypothetical protein
MKPGWIHYSGYPLIELKGPGDEGDETATWNVDVTYEGYNDSGYNVSGEITIQNSGTTAAVITSVVDEIDGVPVAVDFGAGFTGFPYTLPAGQTLIGNYSADFSDATAEFNEVFVTTLVATYDKEEAIDWSGPPTEVDAEVDIVDDSDLNGLVTLSTLDAADYEAGDVISFDYDHDFAWEDYGRDNCGLFTYDNTASVIGDDEVELDSDSATLKVKVLCEELTVTKYANTSFTRTHDWSIDKSVATQNEYELDGVPKIWLYWDGSGDETATWTVDVTYEGYEDSDWNVFGNIIITNTGDLEAVITDVSDLIDGVTAAQVVFDVTFPYTLTQGSLLIGTYSADVSDATAESNEVTVTTERDVYSDDADIDWDEADITEVNAEVDIVDDSDLNGLVTLDTLDAADYVEGDVIPFNYDHDFAWEDYGMDDCGSFTYDNTASVIGDDEVVLDSADATLKVNVQCYIDETAFAKSVDGEDFRDHGFSNWGWTNLITYDSSHEWDLWAAAGQSDTDKGELVGSVVVTYDADGYVTVEYKLSQDAIDKGYFIDETHVYAGTKRFPEFGRGKNVVATVAPGQYYNDSPFLTKKNGYAPSEVDVWVIAHAVIAMPDPNFGPAE